MNTDKRSTSRHLLICVCLCSCAVLFISGCGSPSAANIALRKENQALSDRIAQLELANRSSAAAVRAAEEAKGTLQTLPQDRLDRMFLATGLKIGRLTGGARLRADSPGDDAIKVYVVPTDQTGDEVKAAGSIVIEAFDLSHSQSPLVGRWEFTTEQAIACWIGDAFLYEYVLPCPLKQRPRGETLTIQVTFTDELTQRRLEAQKQIKLTLAPEPATQPAVKLDE